MYHGANSFAKDTIVKRLMLALAAFALFLTAAALPSMADGNPMPTNVCTPLGCVHSPVN
jgi:hypothetical protein